MVSKSETAIFYLFKNHCFIIIYEHSVLKYSFQRLRQDGRFYFLETAARVGGANIVELVEAASGINLWREWALIEIAGQDRDYSVPERRYDFAGVPISLARPDWPETRSFDVVHLHRLGSCRGRLEVTRDGVAFVPKENDGGEAFRLKYTEFLPALADDTLTLRSATRIYRFKAGTSGSQKSVRRRDLTDRIARARR